MTEVETLCAQLTCGDDARAEMAAAQLPQLGLKALEAVRKLLIDQNVDVRWWAVRATAGFDNTYGITGDLLTALQDESADVRQAAAMAFCNRPDPQALAALARALSDPDSMVARLASNALVLLGSEAVPVLLDVLKNEKHTARLEAVRALAEIKDTRTIPGLMKALESDSALVQYWAGLGLDNLGVGMLYLKPD